MLYFGRIDVSEGIDVKKSWYFNQMLAIDAMIY